MRTGCFLLFVFGSFACAPRMTIPVHRVSDVADLWRAIGSDRVIELAPGDYVLSIILDEAVPTSHARIRKPYVDAEWNIYDVTNMALRAEKPGTVRLLTEPAYGNVLTFTECSGIVLENLVMGHGPEKGFCTGGVVQVDSSTDIRLTRCVLFGSGTEGIRASDVSRLIVDQTVIEECSYNILTLVHCEDAVFRSCTFRNNQSDVSGMINVDQSVVVWNRCRIENNGGGVAAFLFEADEASILRLDRCEILNNRVPTVFNRESVVRMSGTVLRDNFLHEETDWHDEHLPIEDAKD